MKRTGAYVADVKVDIRDATGRHVLSTMSEGPILLIDLPDGKYTINAQTNGYSLTRHVRVADNHHPYEVF